MAVAQPRFPVPHGEAQAVPSPARSRWAVVFGATLVLLTLPPLALAQLRVPSGSIFSGYLVIARDAYVYQAIWREGFSGAWLFHSPYTSEALPPILLYPWYLWPGHLLGWAAGPWLYHLLRLLAAGALLGSLWLLVCQLFRSRPVRRWAFTLCALGGGIGIFVPAGLRLGPLTTQPTEMRSPGSSVADLIAMAPHLPWAMSLTCWILLVALRSRRRLRSTELISGMAAVLGLQFIYPQLSLLAVLVVGAWAIMIGCRPPLLFAMGAALVQIPYDAYLLLIWRSTPQALAVIRSSLEVGDPFGFIVLSHLLATALIAAAIWKRKLRGDLILPALWIGGMTLFMFLPGLSAALSRSFMASSIPFGLCATPGLLSLLRSVRRPPWRRRALAATLACSSLYGLFSLAQPYWIASFRLDVRAEYEPAAEASVLQWLAPRVTPRDVVLAPYLDGIFIPAQTGARSFVGHPDMTIDAARKSAEVNAFFSTWSGLQRQAFLRRNGIDYVLASDPAASDRLEGDEGLRRLDQHGGFTLFAVKP